MTFPLSDYVLRNCEHWDRISEYWGVGSSVDLRGSMVGEEERVKYGGRWRTILGGPMLYMVIEKFRNEDAAPVYRRFRDRGRLMPEGLRYVMSWVTRDLRRCFQVMECDDRSLFEEWTAQWEDLVEFEVIPVITSADAVAAVSPRL